MGVLLLGLLLFLLPHSLGLVAPRARERMRERLGAKAWRGLYALVALIGFLLVVWGYGQARAAPTWVWAPPPWSRMLAALLMLPAIVLIVAGNVPRNHLRRMIGHPMLAGVVLWALAHLPANGAAHDIALFGAFGLWSMALFVRLRQADLESGRVPAPASAPATLATIVLGVALWWVFARWLHVWLIGVPVM